MTISDSWERGDSYERYIGRWSRHVAPEFIRWLAVPPGRRWLDVGCGTGALCAAIVAQAAPAAVTGVDPSPGFLERAQANLGRGVMLEQGGASALPLDDASIFRVAARVRCRARLPLHLDGSVDLVAPAWAVRGTSPRPR